MRSPSRSYIFGYEAQLILTPEAGGAHVKIPLPLDVDWLSRTGEARLDLDKVIDAINLHKNHYYGKVST